MLDLPSTSGRPTLLLYHSRRTVLEVALDDRTLRTTPLERRLLGILATHPGEWAPRQVLEEILGVSRPVLNTTVCRLRKSLPAGSLRTLGARKGPGADAFGYALETLPVRWVDLEAHASRNLLSNVY